MLLICVARSLPECTTRHCLCDVLAAERSYKMQVRCSSMHAGRHTADSSVAAAVTDAWSAVTDHWPVTTDQLCSVSSARPPVLHSLFLSAFLRRSCRRWAAHTSTGCCCVTSSSWRHVAQRCVYMCGNIRMRSRRGIRPSRCLFDTARSPSLNGSIIRNNASVLHRASWAYKNVSLHADVQAAIQPRRLYTWMHCMQRYQKSPYR